ncbi:unnamed protein product [Periconia digitata]|uniref:Uncharacterized protein n=1 Tax=Periconia digitata TaxID=1303443 RepID=A0A9W4UGC1_9PLEO|nr:unnamed protein product [Periconia digitata]
MCTGSMSRCSERLQGQCMRRSGSGLAAVGAESLRLSAGSKPLRVFRPQRVEGKCLWREVKRRGILRRQESGP